MRRMIDCTYLHGVARCLRGEANHLDDLSAFLRLTGEVMVADCVLFTADPTGPVYNQAIAAAAALTDAIGDPTFLQHFEIDAVNYQAACENAASDVVADLRALRLGSGGSAGAISPTFENSIDDPDGSLLHDLRTRVASKSSILPDPVLHPAHVAHFVLTRPKVVDALRRSKILDTFAGEKDFLRLSALVRAMVYRHVAAQLNAIYLPASSRARLMPPAYKPDDLRIDKLLEKQAEATHSSFSLVSGVDALVRLSYGEQREILRRARESRSAVLPLRDLLVPSAPGDALGLSFKDHSRAHRIASEFANIVEGRNGLRLIDCIDVQLVLCAIPSFSLQVGKLYDWASARLARRRTLLFADLVRRANSLKAVSAYDVLMQRVGLYDDTM